MTSASVHWLTGTTDLPEDDVLDFVSQTCDGASFVIVDKTRWGYRKRYETIEGLKVLVEPIDPATMPAVCVDVPGAACEFLGATKLQQIASIVKPTRVDVAWDGVPFSVGEVAGWIEAGNMRTRMRKGDHIRPLMGDGGETTYLGSKSSTAQICVYDKRGPVRLELRLRGERAEHAYALLMEDPSEWSRGFVEVLRGVVDFVDRSHTSRGDRSPLLPSWEAFVNGAERVVVALAGKAAPSLKRVTDWVDRQVAKRLHMLRQAGVQLDELLASGASRMRRSDHVLLAGWVASGP